MAGAKEQVKGGTRGMLCEAVCDAQASLTRKAVGTGYPGMHMQGFPVPKRASMMNDLNPTKIMTGSAFAIANNSWSGQIRA